MNAVLMHRQHLMDRIAIVGAGSAGTRHLGLARSAFPDADIRVLRERRTEPLHPDASGQLDSLDDLRLFAPQIGVIASPATRHAESFTTLAELGSDILVEKPLAASLSDAVAIARASAAAKGVALVAYNLRFTRGLSLMRDGLAEGRVGALGSVGIECGQWLPDWRPGIDYRRTVTAQRALGGGALRELSHELDYLRWLAGTPRWVEAQVSRAGDLDIDVEDTVEARFGMDRGVMASVHLDLLRRERTRRTVLTGDRGTLTWDAITGVVTATASDGHATGLLDDPADVAASYRREWDHFLDCTRGEAAPLITVDDALETVRLIEACERSSSEQRSIVDLTMDEGEGL